MIKIVLDTNTIVSAIIFAGKPRQLLYKIHEGNFQLYLSKDIIDDAVEILEKKFDCSQIKLAEIENEITSLGELIEANIRISVIKDDPDVDKILECALEAEADYIISGDKHLLSLGKYGNIEILKAAEVLDLF